MRLIGVVAGGMMAVCVLGAGGGHDGPPQAGLSPDQAMAALRDGNARFVSGATTDLRRDQARRCDTFANGQHPVASILSCADSRVPVELIFDQGIGDLFVIRVAGNVADTDEVGTLEYGVGHLNTPLIVVLGHGKCGAVTAVAGGSEVHGCIGELVDNIVPAVKRAREMHPDLKPAALVELAIRENVWQSIGDIYARSPLIREAAAAGKVRVVGALYDLHSGAVHWMGGHPQESELIRQASDPAHAGGHEANSSEQKAKTAGSHVPAPHAAPPAHGAGSHAPAPEGAAHGSDASSPAEHQAPAGKTRDAVAPATQPSHAARGRDNYLVLGALVAAGMSVSVLVMRFIWPGHKE